MNTRQIAGISALSTALTLAAILALLAVAGPAIAQGPGPAASGSAAPQPPLPVAPGDTLAVSETAPEAAAPQAVALDYLHIDGTAFQPVNSNTVRQNAGNGCVYLSSLGMYPHLDYPLSLPDGVAIRQIRFYYLDWSEAFTTTLSLLRYDDGAGALNTAIVSSTGAAANYRSATIDTDIPLDYVNYSYSLLWNAETASSAMQLCGFRIAYTRPLIFGNAMPLATKNTP